MNSMKKDRSPAFPLPNEPSTYGGTYGMNMRDYFAGKALQGWMASMLHDYEPTEFSGSIARDCYVMADAMMEARKT